MFGKPMRIPSAQEALPGRSTPMTVRETHYVNGHSITPPFPDGLELAMFGLGCFWGAERKFWQLNGVYSTAVGYAAGRHEGYVFERVGVSPTKKEVREVVQVLTGDRLDKTRFNVLPKPTGFSFI